MIWPEAVLRSEDAGGLQRPSRRRPRGGQIGHRPMAVGERQPVDVQSEPIDPAPRPSASRLHAARLGEAIRRFSRAADAGRTGDRSACSLRRYRPGARSEPGGGRAGGSRAYPGMYAHFRMAFRNTGEVLVELLIIWREGSACCSAVSTRRSRIPARCSLCGTSSSSSARTTRADGLMCMIANGVSGQKAYRTDGIALGVAGDRHRTPGACMIVMQRIADLADEETVPPPRGAGGDLRPDEGRLCRRPDGRHRGAADPGCDPAGRGVSATRPAGSIIFFARRWTGRSRRRSRAEPRSGRGTAARSRRLRAERGEAPAVSVAFDFRSPQLTDRESA